MSKLLPTVAELKKKIAELEAENRILSESVFLFQSVFDKLPYGIQVFDSDGYSYKLNQAQKEILGIPDLQEGIGKFNVLTDPYSVANGVNKLYQKVYNGEEYSHEFEYNLGSLENNWNTKQDKLVLNETIFPVIEMGKRVKYVFSVLSDITKLKYAENQLIRDKKELEQSEKQFRVLLDNVPEPVYIQYDDNRFTYLNLAACRLYGISRPEELIGTNVFERIHPEIHEEAKKRMRRIKESNEPIRSVNSIQIRKDGTLVHVELSAVRIQYENKPASLVILKDIDDRIKAERSLRHSHDLMRYIIEHSRSAIAVHDRDLNYIYVSQRYLKEYKVADPDIIGKHHYEVFPDLPEKWRIVHQKALKGEISSSENDVYEKEDGSKEWTRWECRPWYEADGTIGGIIIYTEVITDRIKMQEDLRETNDRLLKEKQKAEASEAQFRVLLENGPIPMFIQTDYKFRYSNKALLSFYGATSPQEVLGTMVMDRIHPDFRQKVKERIQVLNNERRPVEKAEYKHLRLNGEVVDVEISAVPIRYDEQDGALVFLNDITERKKAENEIKKLNENLETRIQLRTQELLNANKELEAFSYSVSHDLRAPLRAIIGYTNILLEDFGQTLEEEGHRICSVISSNALMMGKLIDDLLSFSRLSRNEMQYTRFNMKVLVTWIFNEILSHTEHKSVEFTIDDLPEVTADVSMIKQVWMNLISNAIKYSSQKDQASVSVGYKKCENETLFFITDNGVGFDMQYADKLFGVFQRLHNTSDFEGTGVGLAIVQRIINRHGGRVWAEGKPDSGATFYFALPRLRQ